MGALVIEFGGGKPASKKKGLADAAFSDFMKEKGGKMGEADEGEGPSAAQGAGEEAAQEFLDAMKGNDPAGLYAAFCRMADAHAHGGEPAEEDESEDSDYED